MEKEDLIQKYVSSLNAKDYLCDFEDVETLIEEHLAQLQFSSVRVLLQEEVSLDLGDIVRNLVIDKRGGYCFEHNKLVYETLKHMGFLVQAVGARVVNNENVEVPKTHRVTVWTYKSVRYLIDVGFGFSSPTLPVKFGEHFTTTRLGVTYHISQQSNENFTLNIVKEDVYQPLYTFDMCDYNEADFEMGNFYSYKNPNAKFVKNLVLSAVLKEEVRSLRNGAYQKISLDAVEEINIETFEELKNVFSNDFNYELEDKDLLYLYDNFCKASTGK